MHKRIKIFTFVLLSALTTIFANPLSSSFSNHPLLKNDTIQPTFSSTALNKVKGNVTEKISDSYFKKLSNSSKGVVWRKANATMVNTGIYHLFFKYKNGEITDCLIADSKFNTSKLSNSTGSKQLSYNWTLRTIKNQALPIVNKYIADIENGEITIRHPDSSNPIKGQKHYIDEKNYIWEDYNNKVHYTGKNSELAVNNVSDTHVINNLRTQKQFYEGIIDGKIIPRERIIHYEIDGKNLIQTVKSVHYNQLNNSKIIIGEILEINILPFDDTFIKNMCDQDYEWIKEKGNFPKFITIEDFKKNLSSDEIIMCLENKAEDSIKIKRINSKFKRIDFNKNLLKPTLKGTSKAAILSFALSFGIDAFDGNGMYWKQDLNNGIQGTLIGSTYIITNSIIERKLKKTNYTNLVKNTTNFFKKNPINISDKAISKSIKIMTNSLKFALPGVADFVIGMAYDEIILSQNKYSPELKRAIRLRNIKVNGISSIAGVTISLLTSECGPVAVSIGCATDIVTNILLEYFLPQPDALNPKILLAEYNENPNRKTVEKWFQTNYI